MNRSKPSLDEIERLRLYLRHAFLDLRRQGLFARMNFLCCMSCACAALPKDRPAVYFHGQDNADIAASGFVHIRYCTPDGENVGPLADKIVTSLKSAGLRVEWSGSTSETIVATL